jgi:hypothetical protein
MKIAEDRFELWAIHRPFKEEEYSCRVAIFHSEESARKYIHDSRLKKPSRTTGSAFCKESLLWLAQDAEVECIEALPVEPRLHIRRVRR